MCPDVDPGEFTEMAAGAAKEATSEAVEEAVTDKAKESVASKLPVPSGGGLAAKVVSRALSTDDGVAVDTIRNQYDCSEGFAYFVRGITRMAGIDGVPAGADVVVGLMKMANQADGDDGGGESE